MKGLILFLMRTGGYAGDVSVAECSAFWESRQRWKEFCYYLGLHVFRRKSTTGLKFGTHCSSHQMIVL